MGCGKSKHDVASGNTVLQRKKSNVSSKKNEVQTIEKNNDISVDNVSLNVGENNKKNVKDIGARGKIGDESNDIEGKAPEITRLQEDKTLEKGQEAKAEKNKAEKIVVAEGSNEESECWKDHSLEQNEKEENNVIVAKEKQPMEEKKNHENEKEDVSLGEETLAKEKESKDTDEETFVKEEKSKDTNEETLAKEEETKETTNQEKTLINEGKIEDTNVSTSTS